MNDLKKKKESDIYLYKTKHLGGIFITRSWNSEGFVFRRTTEVTRANPRLHLS